MMHPFFEGIKNERFREACNTLDCGVFISDVLYDKEDRELFKKTLERWNNEVKKIENTNI